MKMMFFYDQKLITYFQATSFSQEAVECFKEIETKMVVVLHYVNKTMPGNLLNTYDSKYLNLLSQTRNGYY